jgi:hypothetical protein
MHIIVKIFILHKSSCEFMCKKRTHARVSLQEFSVFAKVSINFRENRKRCGFRERKMWVWWRTLCSCWVWDVAVMSIHRAPPRPRGRRPRVLIWTALGGCGGPSDGVPSVPANTYGQGAARACLFCQRDKVHNHVHLQPAEIPVPHRRFAHIHVDLVGPLPPSRGHTYLFTIIDRTSRWPEAIPLQSITAADCARALFAGWVSRFRVPATITSDRGAQFMSALWAALYSLLNIKHSPTTAYHPQSNGLVARFHRRLKDALRSRAAAASSSSIQRPNWLPPHLRPTGLQYVSV